MFDCGPVARERTPTEPKVSSLTFRLPPALTLFTASDISNVPVALLGEVELVPVFAFRVKAEFQEVFLRFAGGDMSLRYKLKCVDQRGNFDPEGKTLPFLLVTVTAE